MNDDKINFITLIYTDSLIHQFSAIKFKKKNRNTRHQEEKNSMYLRLRKKFTEKGENIQCYNIIS